MATYGSDGEAVGLVRRLFGDVFEGRNLDATDELLMPDFQLVYPFPGFGPGAEGLKQFVNAFHEAFSDLAITIESIFQDAEGGKVGVRWTARGRHTGDLLGIPPSGNQITALAIGEYTFCPPYCSPGDQVETVVIDGQSIVAAVMDSQVSGTADEALVVQSTVEVSGAEAGPDDDVTAQPIDGPKRIAAGWLVMDNLGLLQQMGAVPPHKKLFPKLGGPEA